MRLAPNATQRRHPEETSIRLQIADPLVERVVRVLLTDASWDLGASEGTSILITDLLADLPERGAVVVLRPTPASCAAALRHLSSGSIGGAACRDDIDELLTVVKAVAQGLIALPRRILSIAAEAPAVTDRQTAVLEALMEGLANRQIARRLRLSEATVKRDLAHVAKAMHVTNRSSIVATAYELGYGVPPSVMR